mmetsp:Transcript_47894/g.115123  ORF Transcript_47894/g.115123 Transcript_47894/m.115123 type:complete len:110 (-) Transcript_47894:19-348(-)
MTILLGRPNGRSTCFPGSSTDSCSTPSVLGSTCSHTLGVVPASLLAVAGMVLELGEAEPVAVAQLWELALAQLVLASAQLSWSAATVLAALALLAQGLGEAEPVVVAQM